MMITILQNYSLCLKMKGKNSKRAKINYSMILTTNVSWGLSSKTSWSNLKMSLVEKMWSFLNSSSKSTIFCIRIRISQSKTKDWNMNLLDFRSYMEEKYNNSRLSSKWKLAILKRPLYSITINLRNSKKKDSNTYSNLLLSFRER